jgi:hypothetical protein
VAQLSTLGGITFMKIYRALGWIITVGWLALCVFLAAMLFLFAVEKKIVCLSITVAVLAIYILSGGPAVYLQRKKIISPRVIDVVYMPLQMLDFRFKPFHKYISWWHYTKIEREHIASKKLTK